MCSPTGCKDIEIGKLRFVAIIHFGSILKNFVEIGKSSPFTSELGTLVLWISR